MVLLEIDFPLSKILATFFKQLMLLTAAKFIGGGLATISLSGAGVGIGIVFAGYIRAVGANPKMEKPLFLYTIVGFALTEAIALFGIMMAFIIIYS